MKTGMWYEIFKQIRKTNPKPSRVLTPKKNYNRKNNKIEIQKNMEENGI